MSPFTPSYTFAPPEPVYGTREYAKSAGNARRSFSYCQIGPKRRRHYGNNEAPEAALDDLPDDTEVAIMALESHFPRELSNLDSFPPIILRSQIYSMLSNRLDADITLDKVIDTRKFRELNVPNTITDMAIIRSSYFADYITYLGVRDNIHNYQLFIKSVLLGTSSVCIVMEDLEKELNDSLQAQPCSTCSNTTQCIHHTLSEWVRCGMLCYRDPRTNWITVPNMGKFFVNIINGTNEVLAIIRRKKNKQILLRDIEDRQLKRSFLPSSSCVKVLLGTKKISVVHTTLGPLLQISEASPATF